MSNPKKYNKSGLTPAKKKFAQVYAKTDNATEAVRQAYPTLQTSDKYLTLKGHRLIANDSVSKEIDYQKGKLEQLASKSVARLEKLIDSDDENVATKNIWNTIHQVQGKPLTKIEQTSTGVTLNIDLASSLSTEEEI